MSHVPKTSGSSAPDLVELAQTTDKVSRVSKSTGRVETSTVIGRSSAGVPSKCQITSSLLS
eukprot:11629443-Ditylum_brightwellii.AAC.1